MNAGNIFEAFFLAKEKIAKEPDIFSDPEYMKILQSIKKYFDSFVWVSNPMDRLIYLYAGKGYNNNAVADFIGVNVNTYRSRVVIDVDETIRSASEIVEKCVFGGWIYKDYVELFDTINTLQLFKALIPDILRREMILCG